MAPDTPRKLDYAPRPTFARRTKEFFAGYFWIILKNVIGWILMLSALPLGIALPGPGGLPIFLIGFALVTFPGKRRLTARVMRGRGVQLEAAFFTVITSFVSLLVTGIIIWVLVTKYGWTIEQYSLRPGSVIGVCVLAAAVTWLVTRLALRVMNFVLVMIPRMRRKFRPWLRKHGMKILPPRRKHGVTDAAVASNEEIIEIHPRHHHALRTFWTAARPWLTRAASLAITIAIFVWILQPIRERWADVRDEVLNTSPLRFVLASVMFAVFLFLFRAVTWRQILAGFGHRLPVPAATRIFAVSELARYVPGAIWQVVGRVLLVKPYGVSGSVSSTSQILEIATFLLANVIVASMCLLYFGVRKDMDGSARVWLYTAMALVPTLAFLLHPRVFYGAANAILRRLGKPAIVQRLRGKKLVGLLGWSILGLLWQSLAVWLITADALNLPIVKWWVVGGAYCLAWCAGFLAFWAPGGIGVREVVFMTTMLVVLPPQTRAQFTDDPNRLYGFLAFLSVLLRLWTTAGELILTVAAVTVDLRGALGHEDAPGRMPPARPAPAEVKQQLQSAS